MMSNKLKWALYPFWFWLIFIVSVYVTFPVHLVKGMLVAKAEESLGKDHPTKVGKHGVNPEVTINRLALYRLSGLSFERLKVRTASSNPDPGPELIIDTLNVRVGIFSLLTDTKSVSFSGTIYDGAFSGTAEVDDKGAIHALDLEIDGIKLDKSPLLLAKTGAPVTGDVNATVHLVLGPEPHKDGAGEIVVDTKKLSLGPGELKVSIFGLSIPLIDMGALTGKIVFDKGKGQSQDLKLVGKDLNAEVEVGIDLVKNLEGSRIQGGGSFLIDKQFIEENGKFKAMLDIAPGIDKAKDSDGRTHFLLRGTFKNPSGALSKKAGDDRKTSTGKKGKK